MTQSDAGQSSAQTRRWGLTIPVSGIGLAEHRDLICALPSWGYTDVWTSEVAGADAFTPLAAAAAWEPSLRLGTAIVPAFTRGPALIAQSAAALAALAPGRVSLGIGASSPTIVEEWNAIRFDQPYRRTRDVLRMVRTALAGGKVSQDFETFSVRGFRLEIPPQELVKLHLAALRPRMLALAGREADGVILNWLAAGDVSRCTRAVANSATEVVARIFVCPTEDRDYARTVGRRMIAAYLTVEAYAQFQRWLGRGDQLAELWSRWQAGDRAGAAASVPDVVVDELLVHGTPAECRQAIQAYVVAGVAVPVIALVPTPEVSELGSLMGLLESLGPA